MLSDGGAAGDVYEQLYADHAGAVLTYLTNRLRDPDVAQDIAQNTWLKAHRFLPDVLGRGDTAGKPWLMQIATHAMVDHWRRVKTRPQTQDIDAVLAPGIVLPVALMDQVTPETELAARSQQGAIRRIVGVLLLALPRHERELLWWFEYGHRTYAELAHRYDCTVPAVKGVLYRTRQRLDALVASEVAAQRTRSGGLAGRFAFHSDQRGGPDACWPWLGTTNRGNPPWVPMLRVGGARGHQVPARRIAYALRHGAFAPWVYPIATCGAPDPVSCVNPAHLVGARKGGIGVGQSGGRYVPLEPSQLHPDAFADQNLIARRLALGITALEVAALAGINKQNVYQVENARARWNRGPVLVQRILAVLDRLEHEQQEAAA